MGRGLRTFVMTLDPPKMVDGPKSGGFGVSLASTFSNRHSNWCWLGCALAALALTASFSTSAGQGFRLKASLMMQEFNRAGPVLHLLLRYTQALITQMTQTAVCNRHHSLDQQLCRWLLLSLDRLHSDELVMTQELIANMLGVRREGVTEAAGHLQNAGLIRYRRGRITVIDREQLEQRTCECYSVVKKEYDRLLPATTAT